MGVPPTTSEAEMVPYLDRAASPRRTGPFGRIAAGKVPALAPARGRRGGGALSREGVGDRGLREAGRPETDPPAALGQRGLRGDVPGRGAAGGFAASPEHRPDL